MGGSAMHRRALGLMPVWKGAVLWAVALPIRIRRSWRSVSRTMQGAASSFGGARRSPVPSVPEPVGEEILLHESLPGAPDRGDPCPLSAAESPPRPWPAPARQWHHRDEGSRLRHSISGLSDRWPELSAVKTFSGGQRSLVRWFGAVFIVGLVTFPAATFIALISVATTIYMATLLFRLDLFRLSLQQPLVAEVGDAEALSIPDDQLPVYTILVPAYREPQVVERLLGALDALDYPAHLLDVKLLLEADDHETIEAADAAGARRRLEVVLVPPAEPRTKPKALNYGLTLARGQLITIYDAEDRPEPLQLRRAAVALGGVPDDVACLQAKLSYFNPGQNVITRWFTVEYLMWFSQFLPGLARVKAPVPLGGTSNHFRVSVLTAIGGWDPFNVTEDADLGVRLHRAGYRTGVLESTTQEEANSDFVNWMKQRSRWYKGYLQTWLVHMRDPWSLYSELGWRGFLRFNLFVGGTPLLALLNPVFWLLTLLWFVARPPFIPRLFPTPVYYTGIACWLVGNFSIAYASLLSAVEADRYDLMFAAALTPLYWVMMSMAATKAALQLITAPSFWEKTQHGLDTRIEPEEPRRVA